MEPARMSERWPLRTPILAWVGALAGLVVWLLLVHGPPEDPAIAAKAAPPEVWRVFIAVGAAAFAACLAFTLSRVRMAWTIGFSAAAAAMLATIAAWSAGPLFEQGGVWRWLCAGVALAVALPVFQTVHGEGRWTLPYPRLHHHAWSDAVLLGGAIAFAAVFEILLELWAALFDLIGIAVFTDLFGHAAFDSMARGAALAGGVSLLRDWSGTVGALQKVVMAALGIFAPILGFALLLFLASLPVTGLATLWEATRSTTPVMLGVVLLALLLVNAVIGNGEPGENPRAPALQWGARALGLAVLPLALIAAVSTEARIAQHGLTPERLWAVVFVTFAVACGALYTVGLARGLARWPDRVRAGNIVLALGIGVTALLLATPLLDWDAISARAQVARLAQGRVAPEDFDFGTLKARRGEPGKAAYAGLKAIDGPRSGAIRAALAEYERKVAEVGGYDLTGTTLRMMNDARTRSMASLDLVPVYPKGSAWPAGLKVAMAGYEDGCGWEDVSCAVLLTGLTGAEEPGAIFLERSCFGRTAEDCYTSAVAYRQTAKGWVRGWQEDGRATPGELLAALPGGTWEIRQETRRDIYVNGKPIKLD